MTGTPTSVTFLLDRSGSMEAIKDDTIGAFNAYLGTLREGEGIEFSLIQFDSIGIDKLHVAAPVKSVADLTAATFQPRGSTPLIDAAYKTIKAVETAQAGRHAKIVVCIQTDGHENASVEHSWADLNALIKEKAALGWQFNFMGAGIDAYDQGRRMGIDDAATVAYSLAPRAMRAAFAAKARNTVDFAEGRRADTRWTPEQKRDAGDAFDRAGAQGGGAQPDPNVAGNPGRASRGRKKIVDDFAL